MICKRCKSQIFNGAASCPFCGAIVGAENETDTTHPTIPDLNTAPEPSGMPDLTANPAPAVPPVTPPAAGTPPTAVPPVQPPSGALPTLTPFGEQPNPVQPQHPSGSLPTLTPFGEQPNPVQPPQQPSGMLPPLSPFGEQPNPVQPPASPFGQPETKQDAFQSTGLPQNTAYAGLPPLNETAAAKGVIPMRLTAKILIVVALLCFCLPFVTVSCSMGEYGEQEIGTYSGFQLMTGDLEYEDPSKQMNDQMDSMFGEGFFDDWEYGDDEDDAWLWDDDEDEDEDADEDEDEDEPSAAAAAEEDLEQEPPRKNYFLIGAFLSGIAAFGLLFIKGKRLEIFSMALCAIASALTMISSVTFVSFYHVTENPEMADLITVKTRYGIYVVLVTFILGGLAALKEHFDQYSSDGY
ncbi:MAG: hypothetical protein IKI77_05770 [Oscillospiraceae bacterium]|nr:hypothetical protein [Oscillospiraceae bacterium]